MLSQFDRTVPVTLLGEYLATTKGVTDSVAALHEVRDTADEILKEKAVASIALRNSLISLWDPQGFTNTILILNHRHASVDVVAAPDPMFMAYGVWELDTAFPTMAVGPETMRTIVAGLKTFDYVYPPDELGCVEDRFLKDYKQASPIKTEYYSLREQLKRASVEDTMQSAYNALAGKTDFIRFHTLRLIANDLYVRKLQDNYYTWKERIRSFT